MTQPLDPEMQAWLAGQAATARRERAELYERMKTEGDAIDLARARGVLASIPPPLPGQVPTFVKIYEGSPLSGRSDGEIQWIEGTVFDIYSVMTGGMGGDDDFDAFKVIGDGDRMTSWRKGSIDVALGNLVRIKFFFIKPIISRGDDDDHLDDPILGVWIGAKDQIEAVQWYRKVADQNNAAAQCDLGFCYDKGEGVAKDQVEAMKWYHKAAEQNNATAQFNLGIHYASGEGVAKDQVEAAKWYGKAAEQNHAPAQFNLGVRYDGGNGVTKDQAEAAKWYRKAAELNHAKAQLNLSVCYDNGEGVAKDLVKAYKWLVLAARQGDEDAKKNLPVLEKKMTPEQMMEGQELASGFKPLTLP